MSNYTPGVTGQESYFDATPETTECVQCGTWFANEQDGAETCPECTARSDGDSRTVDENVTDGVARDIGATLVED